MSEEFPDRNLDALHARVASSLPEPVAIALPAEPPHTMVIEALNDDGDMEVAWRSANGRDWVPFAGPRSRRVEDWANIVEAALRNRWTLQACYQPGERNGG